MSQIKERPILFNAPMVRAILEGRKTVTRRAVKPQPEVREVDMIGPMLTFKNKRGGHWLYPNAKAQIIADCPYGQPGDRLWVREAFRTSFRYDAIKPSDLPVSPTGKTLAVPFWYDADLNGDLSPLHSGLGPGKYRPGMFMPRAACRILLEITDVRIERLQDISEDQALAEGIIPHVRGGWHWHPHDPSNVDDWHQFGFKSAAYAFQDLWIGTGGNWDANPWVWVVEFKRVTP